MLLPRGTRAWWVAGFSLSLICLGRTVRAEDAAFDLNPLTVETHGFVSQGFILSTKNNYLARSKPGSAEFTEVGLNVTKAFTDDLRIGIQLFARDLGPDGNYKPQVDWFYLDYRFRDWLGFRAGRTKIPFGLYNEVNDVDAARVPILLPQSMYPADTRPALLAQTGAELYGDVRLGALGELEYRLYGGTIFLDAVSPNPDIAIKKLVVPYVFGGRAMWLTPLTGLQAGFTLQSLRIDTDYQLPAASTQLLKMLPTTPASFNGVVPTKLPLLLWVASLEYVVSDWLFAAEYGRWRGDIESAVPTIFPNSHTVNERYYVMASYHVTSWLTPGAYYSGFFLNIHRREGRENFQHDVALTLRFDLTPHWLLKVEEHLISGTSLLDEGLNDGKRKHEMTLNWTALLLKTTGYF